MIGQDRTQFSQDEIIQKVREVQIDETQGAFGDMVVQRFDPYTAEPNETGKLVSISVVGLSDGHPLFVGCMRSDVDETEAIQSAMDNVAVRCRAFMLRKMIGGILDSMPDDD